MYFSVLPTGKKKQKTKAIINQSKQVRLRLNWQQGQGISSVQSLAPCNTKGFFFSEGGSTEMKGFKCKLSNDSAILEYYHACEGLLKIR